MVPHPDPELCSQTRGYPTLTPSQTDMAQNQWQPALALTWMPWKSCCSLPVAQAVAQRARRRGDALRRGRGPEKPRVEDSTATPAGRRHLRLRRLRPVRSQPPGAAATTNGEKSGAASLLALPPARPTRGRDGAGRGHRPGLAAGLAALA